MTDSLTYFCPRLVDYIVIVGHSHPSIDSEEPLQPQILKRYPAEDHPDFFLPGDIAYFCQPEGCTTIGAKQMSLRDRQSFVFALTDKDSGRRRYGTCLNFYRPFKQKYGNRKPLTAQASVESSSSTEGVNSIQQRRRVKALKSHTLTSLCIISHHALFSTFRECLNILAKLIEVSNSSAAKQKQAGRRSHNAVWKFLTGSLKRPIDGDLLQLVKQLETWIYSLLSAPVPVPGKCRLELYLVPENLGQVHILALPDPKRFSLVDFPLHLPLELMGIEKCIQVVECIMLEQKVLLMSRDYNALTLTVLALVAMLYPLEYMFPVIPLLPASMENSEQLLNAPTPYIIGIPASFGKTRRTCLPDDVWLFDLDSDNVTAPPGPSGQVPPLPEPEGSRLRTHLKQSLASMSMSPKPVKNFDDILNHTQRVNLGSPSHIQSAARSSSNNFNPFIYGNDIDCVDLATRVAMVRFLASPNVLGNIQEHTRILRLYPRPVVGFQLNSFLKSRPTHSLFICKLAATQAVEFYTEWVLNPSNVVFARVQTGIFDPKEIGDKPRWYALEQEAMTYNVCSSSNMSIFNLAEQYTEAPTDESGASDDEHFYSMTSDSDADSGANLATVTVQVDDVYKPPTELHRMETLVALHSSNESDSSDDGASSVGESLELPYVGDVPAISREVNSGEPEVQSPEVLSPKPAPRRPPPPLNKRRSASSSDSLPPSSPAAVISNLSSDIGEAAQSATSKLTSFFGDKLSPDKAKPVVQNSTAEKVNELITSSQMEAAEALKQAHSERMRAPFIQSSLHPSDRLREKLLPEPKSIAPGENQNQAFVKEMVNQVLSGHGVSWLKSGRFKRLMEDESYRSSVMKELNTQLDKKLTSEEQTVEDVHIPKPVYKGMVAVLSMVIHGLEHTYKNSGQGGVASALMVLEVASTHYYIRDNKSNSSSLTSSPFGSRESLASYSKEGTPVSNKYPEQKRQEQASATNKEDRTSLGSLTGSITPDDDIMHKLVVNKDLLATQEQSNIDLAGEDNQSTASRRSSCRSPITYQSLKKMSAASDKASPSPTPSESSQVDWLGQLSDAINNYSQTVMQNELNRKSQMSSGYRYVDGRLVSVTNSSAGSEASSAARVYVYEGLLGKSRSHLWDKMQFWEDVFLDAVAQEREIIGLDQQPAELMERYQLLGEFERKHLEHEEDKLLSTMLHNLTSFMVMMQCQKSEIRKKNRRLLGKSHIGLKYSQAINNLLDNCEKLNGNDIDLKPLPSRMVQKKSFKVHRGSDNTGDMMFMEVRDDCILLKTVNHVIVDRWWYERLVNMSYNSKTKVLCLSRRESEPIHTEINKFYTKKCKDVYHCIKETMERAAARRSDFQGAELGGEFPAQDMETGKSGLLQVCMDGIGFLVDKTRFFVELSRIKKCFTQRGGIFVLEELDSESGEIIQRRFLSEKADLVCYAVTCMFSYAAGESQISDQYNVAEGSATGL